MAEADLVECGNCGRALEEPPNVPIDRRMPCPGCGSNARKYFVSLKAELRATAHLTATLSTAPTTTILLQAVISPGQGVPDGRLVETLAPPWYEIVALLEKDPSTAFQISDRKWEEIVAGAYKKAGFDEVILTPRSGDHGRDIIAIKHGLGKVRIIDQVKAYKPGHLVTANDVRALIGVLHGDHASKGFLTTTSDFAPRIKNDPLITPFMPARLELINGETLMRRLQELAKHPLQ